MSALFDFQSFLTVVLLFICTCTYVKISFPKLLEQKTGFVGFFWKAARIGERLSPWVGAGCLVMGTCLLLWDNRSTPEGTDAAVSGSKQTAPLQPEENIQARWQRLGPYPPTGFHVDKNPVPLGSEEDGWCGLCGVRSGWMQCGRCSGEGDYLTLPGRAGVKDKVGRARCKMCFGRGAVPCVLCGLPDMERWNQWHAYAKRNPVKKKSQ